MPRRRKTVAHDTTFASDGWIPWKKSIRGTLMQIMVGTQSSAPLTWERAEHVKFAQLQQNRFVPSITGPVKKHLVHHQNTIVNYHMYIYIYIHTYIEHLFKASMSTSTNKLRTISEPHVPWWLLQHGPRSPEKKGDEFVKLCETFVWLDDFASQKSHKVFPYLCDPDWKWIARNSGITACLLWPCGRLIGLPSANSMNHNTNLNLSLNRAPQAAMWHT